MPSKSTRDTKITIRGARTHNLQNIDLDLPQKQLIIVTGVSGSGKSSLAFDTVYAEGQRRYVESLSAYARQFLERMPKPDVDVMEGICPAIAIRQKNRLRNPRSTVGTTTEIHDYLRLLFARVGRTICRGCGNEVFRDSAEVAARQLAALAPGTRLLLGFEMPVVEVLSDGHAGLPGDDSETGDAAADTPVQRAVDALRRKGFRRVIVDGQAVSFDALDVDALKGQSTLRVVVDRIKVAPDLLGRITDSVETAYLEGGGTAFAVELSDVADGSDPTRTTGAAGSTIRRRCGTLRRGSPRSTESSPVTARS